MLKREIKKIYYMLLLVVLSSTMLYSQSLRINELMSSNSSTIADSFGEYSDWIELYNASNMLINLSGWNLTDDSTNLLKWSFPEIEILPEQYMVIFASGKDTLLAGNGVHTSFKISASGEFIALINPGGDIISRFDTTQTALFSDVSLAYFDGDYLITENPTPGSVNLFSDDVVLSAPAFSVKHGFYDSPFMIKISSNLSNAEIYYTTDGSIPEKSNGKLYTTPINITATTVLRAIVVKSDLINSEIATSTYIFVESVLDQPNNPQGYPAQWGTYTAIAGNAIADYEMDQEIIRDSRYTGKMTESLKSLPVLSIVTDKNNLFSHDTSPDKGGIYVYTGAPADNGGDALGKGWERPASVELFDSGGLEDLQVDCGIVLHGGHSRRPEKCPKHSFRLEFKSEYGAKKLDYPLFGDTAVASFNSLVLRAGFGNSWNHWTHGERKRAQFIRDVWAKETQLDMGYPAGHGRYIHLYLNGLYWGVYNVTERIDEDFAENYLGGNKDDYDIMKDYNEVASGNTDAWRELFDLAGSNKLSENSYYQMIQGRNPDGSINPGYKPLLDVVNFIDYMLINFYGGNWDWDHHNWIAIRNRINPGKGFKFFSWDAEHILERIDHYNLDENNSNRPSQLFHALTGNDDFQELLAERVQLHFYNGGDLSPEAGAARYRRLADKIELAMIAESARWGDYRRDVHQYSPGGPFDLYDKAYWDAEKNYILNDYFPQRGEQFLSDLREDGLISSISAPQILINNNEATDYYVNPGDILTIYTQTGDVYYTLDSSDPRINGTEYSSPISITNNIHIKTSRFTREQWSDINEKVFIVSKDLSDLKLTEIHYNPLPEDSIDGDLFEFIELKNISEYPMDLNGASFSDGISFEFPAETFLDPKKFIVLASDRYYFTLRYNFEPFDEYANSLSNSGEKLVLLNSFSDTLLTINYSDSDPWPSDADGEGYSLVAYDTEPEGDLNDPSNWISSENIHGSPGQDDGYSIVSVKEQTSLPEQFRLGQNYPNPFNPSTTIEYTIPNVRDENFSSLTKTVLKIYDILGREVATLVNARQKAGTYSIPFDGSGLASGIYFYKLHTDTYSVTKKLILIK